MPINQITPQSQIDGYIDERIERLKQAIIYNLCAIGEKVRNEALERGSYTDQTKNLRSSVGYVIVIDGQLYKVSEFGKPDGNNEGKEIGASYAQSLISKFPKGIVLIVVAGMKYAGYVSAKGYNVLDSSELLAEQLVPELLKQLGINK
ncbi:hypothetical protein [Bacteroides sp.]|uniref:hypothetical protein n=1 Tax=Bacteroides sp. TaxID=29523 RepID=UPI002A7EF321|nr:hypothetical protein [Bacteroides sp.]